MDKSWILKDRDSLDYEIGVENFLIFAKENAVDCKNIPCPCGRCGNFKKNSVKIIRGHLYENGFSLGYTEWIWHGEKCVETRSSAGSSYPPDLNRVAATQTKQVCEAAYGTGDYDEEAHEFKRFVADAEQPLFEGSECTKLESMLKLHNWKSRFGISDAAFTDLLSSVGSFLPSGHVLPVNAYEAKKNLSDLGLDYIKIHACPNDCILYRGVYSEGSKCPKCNLSRWKLGKDGRVRTNVPAKVLWYFPIIPRFKRLFKSPSTAEMMSWHANHRIQDGLMRHPADSPSWRNIDHRWPIFGSESRNLRLALSADGINPHTNKLINRYSCWPVVLVTYNLPPWLCMKRKFMMLTLLVSGPHEPGNNIDVYLQPMIDDLKKLWEEGEPNVFDGYSKSYFTLRAILLWTINDFPAYGNLSGCVNKGYMACPICCDDTIAKYLTHSRKMCYQGHRRYLPRHHPYRRQKTSFNGEQEHGQAREPLSGEEVLAQQQEVKFTFGKEVKNSQRVECVWKKKSIFFELEYWKFHHIRHCLDVMHIEKNVCDSLIGTLLNMRHKSKDSEASRRDMMEMGVRGDLAPQVGEKKTYLPPAPYTLSKAEKKKVLSSFLYMKVPFGHSSNIKNCVSMSDMKMYGLKSHDCHILLQQLLPVAIRSVLPKHVRISIIRLCFFFNSLCNKVVDVSKLDKLQSDVIVTLCELEKIFPPSFFDVMIHLTVHLVRELRLCGPVFYRWMYAFERFNKVLKSYVRNRYYPEGCIAESYIKEESVEFCSEFVGQSGTAGLPNEKSKLSGPLSAAKVISVEENERDEAHLHVLQNNSEVYPYILMHKEYLERLYQGKKKVLSG
ncbi:uncharacterized protein LOC108212082 [Daucus carota subsp. sativus]|uniref:uncharacterized protein LOC108212082 n=1 Tax=Daucus carota subsp. sativus TaxID=79200 RepID=UPI003083016E